MISDALTPIQSAISDFSSRLGNVETTLSPIPEQIAGLQTNDATMSAAILDLQQRVAALEGSVGCATTPSGLISWWPGDGNANDIAGSNSGSLQNGATFTSGQVGQAFSFDGVDDFVQSGTTGLPIGSSDRTIELWVKINSFLDDSPNPSSPLEAFFAGYGNFSSSTQLYVLGTAGNILFFSQWGNAVFGPSLEIGKWYHVAVANSGNSINLYLNGMVISSGVMGVNTPAGTSFYIGRAPGSFGDIRRLNGFVDEVSIYDRALTLNEIKSIFDAGSQGKCK